VRVVFCLLHSTYLPIMSRVLASSRQLLARAAAGRVSAAVPRRALTLSAATSRVARSAPVSRMGALSAQAMQRVAVRHLNLHEYQSKALMAKYNVRVQKGEVASSPEEAQQVAERLLKAGAKELVIKAQVHAGGRGKGHFTNGFKGGVKITTDPKAIKEYASKMIGSSLITAQTGPEGQPCKQVRSGATLTNFLTARSSASSSAFLRRVCLLDEH